jgi:hypothetical protein
MNVAVDGRICINPTAPCDDRAAGLKSLSRQITAAMSSAGTPLRSAWVRIVDVYSSGYQWRAYQAGIARCTVVQAVAMSTIRTPRATSRRRA